MKILRIIVYSRADEDVLDKVGVELGRSIFNCPSTQFSVNLCFLVACSVERHENQQVRSDLQGRDELLVLARKHANVFV